MTATIHQFPRKRARSLSERAAQMACERTTEQLKSELAVNLSAAIKARQEKIRQQRDFATSAGLAL